MPGHRCLGTYLQWQSWTNALIPPTSSMSLKIWRIKVTFIRLQSITVSLLVNASERYRASGMDPVVYSVGAGLCCSRAVFVCSKALIVHWTHPLRLDDAGSSDPTMSATAASVITGQQTSSSLSLPSSLTRGGGSWHTTVVCCFVLCANNCSANCSLYSKYYKILVDNCSVMNRCWQQIDELTLCAVKCIQFY